MRRICCNAIFSPVHVVKCVERDQNWPDMDFDNMPISTTQPTVAGLDDDDLDDLDGTS